MTTVSKRLILLLIVSNSSKKLLSRSFQKESARNIYQCAGSDFGFIHGSILTPERTLRSDVITLVTFDGNQDDIQGYKAGRQWFKEPDISLSLLKIGKGVARGIAWKRKTRLE